MRRFMQAVTALVATVGVATAAAAQAMLTIRGPVIAVDPQQDTIQVRDQGGQAIIVQLPPQPDQLIRQNGQPVPLESVRVGQMVEVRAAEVAGQPIVQQVDILPAPVTSGTAQLNTGTGTATTQVQTAALPGAHVTTVSVDVDRWGPMDKLLRGVGNTLLGFIELPRGIFNTSQRDGILPGLTVGTIKGVGYTIARMGAGAYDVVTFPLPIPEDYRPLLQPEFPWESAGPESLG